MGDVDAEFLADAAREYAGLKRRYWRLFFAPFLIFVLGLALAFLVMMLFTLAGLPDKVAERTVYALVILTILAAMASWVCAVATWGELIHFRCPRCDERFTVTWMSRWPGASCKHCGLRLG